MNSRQPAVRRPFDAYSLVVPDRIFADARFAEIYDDLDGIRDDLDHYELIVAELEAESVLDVGCGTGVFARRLGARGLTVVGVDPAAASLEVAASRPGADRVSWMLGDVTTLPPLAVDLATMTGNVAQVFLTDADWSATLVGVHGALRPGGRLVFETRNPADRAWTRWNPAASITRLASAAGLVEHWVELLDVRLPFVSFRHVVRFLDTAEVLTSDSTLRFRDRDEVDASLSASGFTVDEVREAPDRPGREFVFLATWTDRDERS
jgi:SAM-dependent methyltransferase